MRAKILAIQFRKNLKLVEDEQASLVREVGVYSDVYFASIFDESLPWSEPEELMKGYDGLIIGGSGEFYFDGDMDEEDESRMVTKRFFAQLQPLFRYLFDKDTPTLGICLGHQLLGAFAGAQVKYDESQRKSRSHSVKLMVDKNDHFIFSDLPDEFFAHYGHKDTLDRVPDGAVLLMNGGDECKVSALQFKKNIYTVQFHPELDYHDMVVRMKSQSGYLPEGAMAEELFKDDPNSNRILRNFSKFVAMQVDLAEEVSEKMAVSA